MLNERCAMPLMTGLDVLTDLMYMFYDCFSADVLRYSTNDGKLMLQYLPLFMLILGTPL